MASIFLVLVDERRFLQESRFNLIMSAKPAPVNRVGPGLSCDIAKAYTEEIKVETPPAGRAGRDEEGIVFIVQLPV